MGFCLCKRIFVNKLFFVIFFVDCSLDCAYNKSRIFNMPVGYYFEFVREQLCMLKT